MKRMEEHPKKKKSLVAPASPAPGALKASHQPLPICTPAARGATLSVPFITAVDVIRPSRSLPRCPREAGTQLIQGKLLILISWLSTNRTRSQPWPGSARHDCQPHALRKVRSLVRPQIKRRCFKIESNTSGIAFGVFLATRIFPATTNARNFLLLREGNVTLPPSREPRSWGFANPAPSVVTPGRQGRAHLRGSAVTPRSPP